jgi:hypothetical protein
MFISLQDISVPGGALVTELTEQEPEGRGADEPTCWTRQTLTHARRERQTVPVSFADSENKFVGGCWY